jgi:hypothetical protein
VQASHPSPMTCQSPRICVCVQPLSWRTYTFPCVSRHLSHTDRATHQTDLTSHQHTPETRDTMADADARKPDEPLKDEKEVDEQGDARALACALISSVPHALV